MCGGLLGKAVSGIDKFATKMDPLGQGISHWEHRNIVQPLLGKGVANFANKVQSHPVEDAAAVLAAMYGYGALGGGGAGAAGADAGAAGGLSSADAAALYGDAGYTGAAGAGAAGAGLTSADAAALYGDAGYTGAAGAADAAAAAGGAGSWLSTLGGYAKSAYGAIGGAKGSLGIMQALSGLYGYEQSRRVNKMAQAPDPRLLPGMPGYQAGLEAVQRSLASQGYQGSGNMMAALQKYGGEAYQGMWQGNLAAANMMSNANMNSLGSLGLIAGGLSRTGSSGG